MARAVLSFNRVLSFQQRLRGVEGGSVLLERGQSTTGSKGNQELREAQIDNEMKEKTYYSERVRQTEKQTLVKLL